MFELLKSMFSVNKLTQLVMYLVLSSSIGFALNGRNVDEINYGQKYAIASAKASRDIYLVAQRNFILNDYSFLKSNIDSILVLSNQAIDMADSALLVLSDTNETAKMMMMMAQVYQNKVLNCLVQIEQTNVGQPINLLAEELLHVAANSCVETYKASLYFDSFQNLEDEEKPRPNEERDLTRLETDEFSYITVKQLYASRLEEINEELLLLNEQKEKLKGKELEELTKIIQQLNIEKEACLNKVKKSDDKLVSVKNDLSKEMLQIVHKDIFRTDKDGFYSDNVPVPNNSEMPNGLVFKIQIGFFQSQLPPEHFDGIYPLSSRKVDGIYYRYEVGNFSKYKEAKDAKKLVVEKGYKDSFIVSYFDGEKISTSEAIKIERSDNNDL